jgi:RNA polymerase sigma factor (sigma-70 family)
VETLNKNLVLGEVEAAENRRVLDSYLNGEPDATERVFAWVISLASRYLTRQGLNPQLAEDLTQETAIKMLKFLRRSKLVKTFSFPATTFKIAKAIKIDYFRSSHNRYTILASDFGIDVGFLDQDLFENIITTYVGDDPELETERTRFLMIFETAFKELDEKEQHLINQKHFLKISVKEMAAQRGIKVNTLKARLLRARQCLLRKLQSKL